MPMSDTFENRLYTRLDRMAAHFGTPFHIYDETGIRDTGDRLNKAFSGIPCGGGFYSRIECEKVGLV